MKKWFLLLILINFSLCTASTALFAATALQESSADEDELGLAHDGSLVSPTTNDGYDSDISSLSDSDESVAAVSSASLVMSLDEALAVASDAAAKVAKITRMNEIYTTMWDLFQWSSRSLDPDYYLKSLLRKTLTYEENHSKQFLKQLEQFRSTVTCDSEAKQFCTAMKNVLQQRISYLNNPSKPRHHRAVSPVELEDVKSQLFSSLSVTDCDDVATEGSVAGAGVLGSPRGLVDYVGPLKSFQYIVKARSQFADDPMDMTCGIHAVYNAFCMINEKQKEKKKLDSLPVPQLTYDNDDEYKRLEALWIPIIDEAQGFAVRSKGTNVSGIIGLMRAFEEGPSSKIGITNAGLLNDFISRFIIGDELWGATSPDSSALLEYCARDERSGARRIVERYKQGEIDYFIVWYFSHLEREAGFSTRDNHITALQFERIKEEGSYKTQINIADSAITSPHREYLKQLHEIIHVDYIPHEVALLSALKIVAEKMYYLTRPGKLPESAKRHFNLYHATNDFIRVAFNDSYGMQRCHDEAAFMMCSTLCQFIMAPEGRVAADNFQFNFMEQFKESRSIEALLNGYSEGNERVLFCMKAGYALFGSVVPRVKFSGIKKGLRKVLASFLYRIELIISVARGIQYMQKLCAGSDIGAFIQEVVLSRCDKASKELTKLIEDLQLDPDLYFYVDPGLNELAVSLETSRSLAAIAEVPGAAEVLPPPGTVRARVVEVQAAHARLARRNSEEVDDLAERKAAAEFERRRKAGLERPATVQGVQRRRLAEGRPSAAPDNIIGEPEPDVVALRRMALERRREAEVAQKALEDAEAAAQQARVRGEYEAAVEDGRHRREGDAVAEAATPSVCGSGVAFRDLKEAWERRAPAHGER